MNLALIETVRNYPHLYDTNDKKYGDMYLKEITWSKIAKKMNQTHSACKRCWNNLRDGYRRSLKKNKTYMKNGIAIKKRWKYDEEMVFLLPFLKEREIPSKISVVGHISDEDDYNPDEYADFDDPGTSGIGVEDFMEPSSKKLKLSVNSEPIDDLKALLLKNILENKTKQEDDTDVFFSAMALTVKKFSPYQRAVAKQRLFAVISEMELQNLMIEKQQETNATELTLDYTQPVKTECEDYTNHSN